MRLALILSYTFIAFSTYAQQLASSRSVASEAAVIERGPNHRVWERTVDETSKTGFVHHRKHSYTEIATGLCYSDGTMWIDADPEIVIVPDGTGVTQKAAHSAHFLADISSDKSVSCAASGQQINSHIIGICYYDWKNRRETQVAAINSSIGSVTDKNHVLYANAFDGLKADVRYSVKKSGLGQDVIFREQIPAPADFQMDPATTRVEVWTEFVQPPPVTLSAARNDANGQHVDDTIDFAGIRIGRGTAFSLENQKRRIPVNKQWLLINGRSFLVESLDYQTIVAEIANLPQRPQAAIQHPARAIALDHHRVVPSRRIASTKPGTKLRIASATTQTPGFVLDYETVSGEPANYTFRGDTTYYVNDLFIVDNAITLEGGTVIKLGPYGFIEPDGDNGVVCSTSPYSPAVFTSQDDDTIGEILWDYTSSSPSAANTWGALGITSASLHDLRFCYIAYALTCGSATLDNIQFVHCPSPIWEYASSSITARNCLFNDFGALISSYTSLSPSVTLVNVTASSGGFLRENVSTTIAATNCIFENVTNTSGMSGSFNGFCNATAFGSTQFTCTEPVFQTIGGGNCYLATTNFSGVGTTNISTDLLAALRNKTTAPPIVISNDITADVVLQPQTHRDTNASLDLGFHYQPIDYLLGGLNLSANALLTNGVVLALRRGGCDCSLVIQSAATFVSVGSPNHQNRIVWNDTVQESSDPNWYSGDCGSPDMFGAVGYDAIWDCRFTDFSRLGDSAAFVAFAEGNWNGTAKLRDCEFHNGHLEFISQPSGLFGVTNCLLDRCALNVTGSPYQAGPFRFANCLIHQGSVYLPGYSGVTYLTSFTNCFFDTTNVTRYGTNVVAGYNAYLTNNTHRLTNSYDVLLAMTNFPYVSGPLGYFYHGTSDLQNKGLSTADSFGLYHYTVLTNQIKERATITDIGFHYVAVGADGAPMDTEADGVPDYIADANGDGIIETGEIEWLGENKIQTENALIGTGDWRITNPSQSTNAEPGWPASDIAMTPEIEGFASATSVNAGSSINLYIDVRDAGADASTNNYKFEIFRMGWYSGLGGRQMTWTNSGSAVQSLSLHGVRRLKPEMVSGGDYDGLIDCLNQTDTNRNWTVSYVLNVPADWVSGVYLVKLTALHSLKQSYIIFVVREDARSSDFICQLSFATYQAYNPWGGSSVYDYPRFKDCGTNYYGYPTNGQTVSFNRPYCAATCANSYKQYGIGAGEYLVRINDDPTTALDYNTVRWLEKMGYDVTYCTSLDTHRGWPADKIVKTLISSGHDEYWSPEERANVEAARDNGVNLCFLGANDCFWRARFSHSDTAFTINKVNSYDKWRYGVNNPEDTLIGEEFVFIGGYPELQGIHIPNPLPNHWSYDFIYETNVPSSHVIRGLLGFEVDGCFVGTNCSTNAPFNYDEYVRPVATNVTKLTDSTFACFDIGEGHSFSTIYTAGSGAQVFATGTMNWCYGLDDDSTYNYCPGSDCLTNYTHPLIQQMTHNVLRKLSGRNTAPLLFTNETATISGNWESLGYGFDGYVIADSPALSDHPSITVNLSNATTSTWPGLATQTRALDKPPTFANGIAAAWTTTDAQNASFTIHVDVGSTTEFVSLYCTDWIGTGTLQKIELFDPADSNFSNPLDVRVLHPPQNGIFLTWFFSGEKVIRVTKLDPISGNKAQVSAIFFDPY